MDITINSAEINDNAVEIDDGSRLPCLVMQYDPPWDPTSVGDHYHYIPLDAIADAQLTFGIASDMEAVEFHILNHAADVELGMSRSKGMRSAGDRRAERGRVLRNLIDQVGDTLLAETRAVDVTDEKSMKEHVFRISTEVGPGNLKMALDVSSASPMGMARTAALESFMGDASAHSIDRASGVYVNLQSILEARSDDIEESRRRVLEMKYGRQINMLIAHRLHAAGVRKGIEK